ncbi:hypothetical protein OROMI_020280 [Orobanche minor]
MADVAGSSGAYYSEYLSLKAADRMAATERRRRRFLMRRRANGGREGVGARSKLAREEGGSTTVGGYPISAPGNGGVLLCSMELESMGIGAPAEAGCTVAPHPADTGRGNPVPVVGAIAVAGRLRYMEDAVCIKTSLCSPAINDFLPVHYFGVFDGHGGPHFSFMCKKKMHEILEGELMGVSVQPNPMWPSLLAAAVQPPPPGTITDNESLLQEIWRRVMSRCFARMERVALHTCLCGSVSFLCGCVRAAMSFSGTTAVTVVLTEKHIVTANCGDSRAVLFRRGRIVPLSFDHKADRKDETARVEASGGRVLNTDTPRVEGILAVTRAIGDSYLKPLVISEPDVTFTRRDKEDEFLILASDGLWDVMSAQLACEITHECLNDVSDDTIQGHHDEPNFEMVRNDEGTGIVSPSGSAYAAALLCRLAVARNSGDNISILVVDLKRVANGEQNDDNMVIGS